MVTPTDPLYATQWHLAMLGDIETIWDEYTGAGVNVGVYDDGIDYNHEDLASNYDASLHVVDDLNNVLDPFPVAAGDGHGTACAGLIGAANNGVGGVGVAFGVTLTSVNINFDNTGAYGSINGPTPAFVDLIEQAAANFDVMSNSWGSFPGYFFDDGLIGAGYGAQVAGAFGLLSVTGRGGLGTVVVQAAGNDDEDANGAGVNASRFTISVAATEQTGIAADYSQYGSCILVTAPAAAVTTDVTGANGYDPGNFTNTFNGTSAATPVVAGVVSLMLDANAGLGWRDVQNILAMSASLTGTAFDGVTADVAEDGLWYANASNLWNGGGNHLHTNYGYGMVNAYNAVRMAEVWTLFGTAQTSANEQLVQSGLNDFADTTLGDGTGVPFTTTFTIATDVNIEHVALHLNFQTSFVNDLRILLTSADGTVVEVANSGGGEQDVNHEWVFGVDGLRGELSAGTWTMQVFDTVPVDTITVRSASLDIYGSTPSTNDTYHFTDEFLAMAAFDPTRSTITDTNGGNDWLNFAAVAGGLALNMTTAAFGVAGTAWGTLGGVFENAIGGDGRDTITGNTSANRLYGFRGMDTLNGSAGADSLSGGVGNDTYIVDRQSDVIVEGTGRGTADRVNASASFTLAANDDIEILATTDSTATALIDLAGNALAQIIVGNAGVNRLSDGGGTGADTLTGLRGNDSYIVANASTVINEVANGGTADGVYATLSFRLAADDNIEIMATTSLAGSLGINLTGNALSQTIVGNAGVNVLSDGGGAGADVLHGKGGNDLYIIGNARTTIAESTGSGTADRVNAAVSFTLAANDNIEILATTNSNGTGLINLTGNAGRQTIVGNAAVNRLSDGGGAGADVLSGLLGSDIYTVANARTSINESTGRGTADRVNTAVTFKLAFDDSIEILGTTNRFGASDIDLTGNAFVQSITGNRGDNNLNGKAGSDVLTGLGGADRFIFNTAFAANNVDSITDYSVRADTIVIAATIFGNMATGVLDDEAFRANLSGTARERDDRIIYDTNSGALVFDSNGSATGGRHRFATVEAGLALTHLDFLVA